MPLPKPPQFSQIPLGKMNRGLVKPIARIRLEPDQIQKQVGIKFEAGADDLDRLSGALLYSATGRQFALVRHQNQPDSGTDILTDERSTNLTADLLEVLRLLRLKRGDLVWMHPKIESLAAPEVEKEDRAITARIVAINREIMAAMRKGKEKEKMSSFKDIALRANRLPYSRNIGGFTGRKYVQKAAVSVAELLVPSPKGKIDLDLLSSLTKYLQKAHESFTLDYLDYPSQEVATRAKLSAAMKNVRKARDVIGLLDSSPKKGNERSVSKKSGGLAARKYLQKAADSVALILYPTTEVETKWLKYPSNVKQLQKEDERSRTSSLSFKKRRKPRKAFRRQ